MTTLSIINMRQSPLHPDNIRDFSPKNQLVADCQTIKEIINNDDLYLKWADLGPDDNKGFARYVADTLATMTMIEGLKAAIELAYSDPRTSEQIENDEWQAETRATRESDYPI